MDNFLDNPPTVFHNLPEIKLFLEIFISTLKHDCHYYDSQNQIFKRLHAFSDFINKTAPRYNKRGLVLIDPTFEDLEFALPLYQCVKESEEQILEEVPTGYWSNWQQPSVHWSIIQSSDIANGDDGDNDSDFSDDGSYAGLFSPAPSIYDMDETGERDTTETDVWQTASAYLNGLFPKSNANGRLLRGIEAIFDFVIQLSLIYKTKSESKSLMFHACCRQFVRAISGKSILGMIHTMVNLIMDFVAILSSMMQSEDGESYFNPFADVQRLFSSWESVKDHILVLKLRTLMHHIVGMTLLPTWGIKYQNMFFNRAEQEALKRSSNSKLGFIGSIVDTVTWIGERLVNVYHTGDWSTFVLNGKTFSSWANSCYDVKLLAQQLYDPETCGFTYNQFVGKVEACLEQGENLVRHAKDVKSVDQKVLQSLLW